MKLKVNGTWHDLDDVDPRTTLLDALREELGLRGTHKGCDHGQCGACTVVVGGQRINSCLALAIMHDGDEVVTVEGLAPGGDARSLHPLQAAFIAHDAFQCGYCTSGQLCAAYALAGELERGEPSLLTPADQTPAPAEISDDELRERMSGNLCRCGAYPNIVAAIRAALDQELA